MPNHDPLEEAPLYDRDALLEPFRRAVTAREAWAIGAEAEKFGVWRGSGRPIDYDGERGVLRVMERLLPHGWEPYRETPGGPVVALHRGRASVTLEPGAQLELSGAPLPDVHAIERETRRHLEELRPISEELDLEWLGIGFHPLARQDDLPWVPKQRYAVMRDYLMTRGAGGRDMMRRTATVQANFDFSSEEDSLRKLELCLRAAPVFNAMFANSPFREGRVSGKKSLRGEVWLAMDPSRSGAIAELLSAPRPSWRGYVEWALDAGMFLFKRGDEFVVNAGQTFRSFLEDGFQGHRATLADWRLHLNTLFPDARLKNTLEVRMCDSLPERLATAVPALFTGLLYDDRSLDAALEVARAVPLDAMLAARPALVARGLDAEVAGRPARELALSLLGLAEEGLGRRARLDGQGHDERRHLAALRALAEQGRSPADLLTEGLAPGDEPPVALLLERTRV